MGLYLTLVLKAVLWPWGEAGFAPDSPSPSWWGKQPPPFLCLLHTPFLGCCSYYSRFPHPLPMSEGLCLMPSWEFGAPGCGHADNYPPLSSPTPALTNKRSVPHCSQ